MISQREIHDQCAKLGVQRICEESGRWCLRTHDNRFYIGDQGGMYGFTTHEPYVDIFMRSKEHIEVKTPGIIG
jgi:hypothetical protein